MKSIGNFKINTIQEIMLVISVAAVILISGFIWIVTERVVSIHEAKLFLSNAVNVPGNTLYRYYICNFRIGIYTWLNMYHTFKF